LRWRRITFITTTWDRFSAAEEVNDLYLSGADGLYVTLKESGFFPEREYFIREEGEAYTVDLAIPCQAGWVSVVFDEDPAPPGALKTPDLQAVRQAVSDLGGPLSPPDAG